WRTRPNGDLSIFPVSQAAFIAGRSPRFGNFNGEKAENAFWEEMVRRGWSAARARAHFGTRRPTEGVIRPDDKEETPDNVVWTARRHPKCDVLVRDGRRILIGGQVKSYDDEDAADAWVYNDVIVTNADGSIRIHLYPEDVFPGLLVGAAAMTSRGDILIVGKP
ncbi:MAG: hypothetical protein AAGL98_14525, partial [Planctomycetota bacterium]